MSETIAETIEQSPLFKHLDQRWQQRLIEAASTRTAGCGEVLVEEGAQAQALHIVCEGKVRVWTRSNGRQVDLKTLEAGAYFGEVSLLSGKEATATVEVESEEARLVLLDADSVQELVGQDAKVRRMLEGVTLARAKDTIGKMLD